MGNIHIEWHSGDAVAIGVDVCVTALIALSNWLGLYLTGYPKAPRISNTQRVRGRTELILGFWSPDSFAISAVAGELVVEGLDLLLAATSVGRVGLIVAGVVVAGTVAVVTNSVKEGVHENAGDLCLFNGIDYLIARDVLCQWS